MSKAVITITDNPNGTIDVSMHFQPVLTDKQTPAQKTALSLLAILKREATGLRDTELHYDNGRVKHLGGKLRGQEGN